MELIELSFTHFWNGYPRSKYRRRWPLLPSFHLPAGKQPFPRCFLPFFDASPLGPTLPTLAGKHTAGSCGLSTKMMVHLSQYAGTRVVPGDGKPPHFCLECRRIVCVNPRSIRLAAFSRPRSRYYPLLYRLPVLRLLCADETSSAQWTICVPSLHLLTLRREDARKGRCAGVDHAHPQALLLPGRHRASVVGKVPVELRCLLSTLLLDMKHDATDRFMRDAIRCCHGTERFFLLHHTMHHCRPLGSGNTVCRMLWPWPAVLDNSRRMASLSCFILSKQALHLLIQCARRGQEEV